MTIRWRYVFASTLLFLAAATLAASGCGATPAPAAEPDPDPVVAPGPKTAALVAVPAVCSGGARTLAIAGGQITAYPDRSVAAIINWEASPLAGPGETRIGVALLGMGPLDEPRGASTSIGECDEGPVGAMYREESGELRLFVVVDHQQQPLAVLASGIRP
jgi:hypothetical protein